MPGKHNYLEKKVLDHIFGGPALASITTVYAGLFTVAFTVDNNAITNEVTGNNYARAFLANTTVNWPSATGTANAQKQNANSMSFPAATGGDWTGINGWGLFDAATINGGNCLYFGSFGTPQTVSNGQTASWVAGGITINEDAVNVIP